MPEGDTIHRTAATMRRALVGEPLTHVDLARVPGPHPALGATIEAVEARGKHLLVTTSDGLVVHTHMRMTGAWHLYRPGERWQRARSAARVVLGTREVTAVCFSAPEVAVLDQPAIDRHPTLRALGPDLCDPAADLDDAVERMDRFGSPDRAIGEALLDQRIACGVGNVYRSEVLFLVGVAPETPVGQLDRPQRLELLATAGRLLRVNLEVERRTTVPEDGSGELWVYGRTGRPCRRCGTRIERTTLGEHARTAYHCPTCQS